MTFATRIAQGSVGLMWTARISGIPYVFSNASLPSSWLTGGNVVIDGETYTPSKTLVMREGMTVSQEISPKQGLSKSGGQTLRFTLDDTWLDLTSTQHYRTGSALAHVIEDVDVNDTSITADDLTAWDASGDAYLGIETVTYSSKTSSAWTVSKRGAYGSQALPILAGGDTLASLGTFGCIAADHPLVWHDRTVQLWCATGTWESDGTFTPFGSTIESADDQRVYQGVINGLQIERDSQYVSVELQPLDVLLDRQVGERLPLLQTGVAPGNLAFSALVLNSTLVIDAEPVDFPGELTTSVLTLSGLIAQVERSMASKIDSDAPGWYTLTDTFTISPTIDDGGVLTLTFRVECTPSNVVEAAFYLRADPNSVWRMLGFEADQRVGEQLLAVNQVWQFSVTADRPYAKFFLPRSTRGTQYLWYLSQSGPGYDGVTDWRNRANQDLNAFVKLGDEIIETGEEVEVTTYGTSQWRVPVVNRARLGSELLEHYIEHNDDEAFPEATQGIGLPGAYTGDAWLYLLCGGSGVLGFQDFQIDRGWNGSGAYIDIDLVDVDSFHEMRDDRRWIASNLGVFKSERLREVMQGDLIGQAYAIVSGADQIRAVDVIPPTISDASAAVMALDHTNTRTIGAAGIGVDLSERRVINRLEILAGLDNATGEWTRTYPATHTTSVGTYGKREPLRMLLRSLSAGTVSESFAVSIATALFGAWGTPYALLEVEVSDTLWWTVEPGSIITLSSEIVQTVSNGISEVTVGRGITALPGRVMATSRRYPRAAVGGGMEQRGTATIVIPNIGGAQTCHWSPTAKCTAITTATLTIEEYEYCEEDCSVTDAQRFADGDYVILRTYDGGTIDGPYEVDSVTATTIVLTTTPATPPTAPFLVEAVRYSNANITSTQKLNAFQADADHKLDLASGSDPPRVYR